MKVGVLQFFSWPERRVPLNTVYDRALQRIDVMDRTGYDAVWLAEHHFSTYSVCPSVHLMGMHVADRTEHLRIGMAVTLASSTTRCASPRRWRCSTCCPAAGSTGAPAAASTARSTSLPGDRRGELRPLPGARRHRASRRGPSERLTYHGTYWDFDDVEVLPKPLQQPHPPMWMAASSPHAVDLVRRAGPHDPDGPPLLTRRDRAQAPPLRRAPHRRRARRRAARTCRWPGSWPSPPPTPRRRRSPATGRPGR